MKKTIYVSDSAEQINVFKTFTEMGLRKYFFILLLLKSQQFLLPYSEKINSSAQFAPEF